MMTFFRTLTRNTGRVFQGKNIWWHGTAIVSTALLVWSGFDWWYFQATRSFAQFWFPAAIVGFIVPVIVPPALYLVSILQKKKGIIKAHLVTQSIIVALFVAACYKAITGREHPELFAHGTLADISHEFHFGFLQGGVFWGWPSSHATVAFALSAAIIVLYRKHMFVRVLAALYALYIGIGVSMTIHWFSDFFAGAIIGTVIGITTAGRYPLYRKRPSEK